MEKASTLNNVEVEPTEFGRLVVEQNRELYRYMNSLSSDDEERADLEKRTKDALIRIIRDDNLLNSRKYRLDIPFGESVRK